MTLAPVDAPCTRWCGSARVGGGEGGDGGGGVDGNGGGGEGGADESPGPSDRLQKDPNTRTERTQRAEREDAGSSIRGRIFHGQGLSQTRMFQACSGVSCYLRD